MTLRRSQPAPHTAHTRSSAHLSPIIAALNPCKEEREQTIEAVVRDLDAHPTEAVMMYRARNIKASALADALSGLLAGRAPRSAPVPQPLPPFQLPAPRAPGR